MMQNKRVKKEYRKDKYGKPVKKDVNRAGFVKESSKKEYLSDKLIDSYENELKTVLNQSEINILRKNLLDICITKDSSQVNLFMSYVVNEIRNFNNQKHKLSFEAQLSDKIYNQFVYDDDKDDEKINGRLLAANIIKFNKIIEQNDEIIKLLKELKD